MALVRVAGVREVADTEPPVAPDEARTEFEARTRAEIAAADALAPGSDMVASRGALLAQVVVVKGFAGPAEASGGAALSGADGVAVVKAVEALGWNAGDIFFALSRPEPGIEAGRRADSLRLLLEAVDPKMVIALDSEARADVAEALGVARLPLGEGVRVLGRRVVAVDGFEASLCDPARKKRVWSQLQAAKAEGPVY
jgi:hypothetical protein